MRRKGASSIEDRFGASPVCPAPSFQIIGSSLLFLYDSVSREAGVWMIDFAKTIRQ